MFIFHYHINILKNDATANTNELLFVFYIAYRCTVNNYFENTFSFYFDDVKYNEQKIFSMLEWITDQDYCVEQLLLSSSDFQFLV